MFRLIKWIQDKFHNRVTFKQERISLLSKYWDSQLIKFMTKAEEVKNEKVTLICEEIDKIPSEIKEYVIK